jgi:hypothetical protein
MGDLLDNIRFCASRTMTPGGSCRKYSPLAAEIVSFVRGYYGGPIRNIFGCPPGDAPTRPRVVNDETMAHVAKLVADEPSWKDELQGAGDAELDVRAWIIEQYEAARAAHQSRVTFCAMAEPGQTPAGYPPAPPIDEPGGRAGREDPDEPKAAAAGAAPGWFFAAAGLALIVASKVKRN